MKLLPCICHGMCVWSEASTAPREGTLWGNFPA